jgi:hypothetical protein
MSALPFTLYSVRTSGSEIAELEFGNWEDARVALRGAESEMSRTVRIWQDDSLVMLEFSKMLQAGRASARVRQSDQL